MIVVDASALVHALTGDDSLGERVRERLDEDDDQHAPQVVKAESLSGLRRLASTGEVTPRRARAISERIVGAEIETYPIESFIPRIWTLRQNLQVYDAWYVALAEALEVPLVTTDGRLARAPGIRCEIDLIPA